MKESTGKTATKTNEVKRAIISNNLTNNDNKNQKGNKMKPIKFNTKTNYNRTNKAPLFNLSDISVKTDIVVNNYNPNEIKVIFRDIKVAKETIKEQRLIIAKSYAKIMPLITKAINAKKLLYPSLSNKNLLAMIKVDFDTKDILVNNAFYLKEQNITLPFGVNNSQLAFIVKHNKTGLISNSILKNLSLDSLIIVINKTKDILAENAKMAVYNEIKNRTTVEVELIA